jgi:hypothetical protein
MQDGSVIRGNRKKNSDIWQFRWWEKTSDGRRIYRWRQIGTVDQIPDLETARKAARLLIPDLNARMAKSKSVSMAIAQLCSHFEQCELSLANTWRSNSTKTIYKVYLKRWIIPKWSDHLLSDIRTIEVESWLRSLPIARSTCAKIRNVMSVLFNHACRYEFFDGNPIRLVRLITSVASKPATSAVIAQRRAVTYGNYASRMASFGALRYPRQPLLDPYRTPDLCPTDLCPTRILPLWKSCSDSTRSSRPPSPVYASRQSTRIPRQRHHHHAQPMPGRLRNRPPLK